MLKSSWEHCTRHDAPPAISHTEQHWHSEADATSCPIMMDSDREQKRHREAQCCQSPYVLKKNSTVAPMRCGSYEEWERVTQGCGRNAQKQMHDGSLNILVRQLWNNIWALGKWFFFSFFFLRRGEEEKWTAKSFTCVLCLDLNMTALEFTVTPGVVLRACQSCGLASVLRQRSWINKCKNDYILVLHFTCISLKCVTVL